MKDTECDIVKDLMQNYIDKVSSEATNELIESHIQTCEECKKVLQEMEKDVDIKPLIDQDEQIDYLKGFKKKKIGAIIATIIITILVLLISFLWISKFIEDATIDINVNDLYIEGWNLDEEEKIGFYFWNNKNDIIYNIVEDKNNKEVYINILGKYTLDPTVQRWGTEITQNIDKIYVKDKDNNTKLIWDKNKGILVEDISNNVRESKKIEEKILKSIYEKNK